MILDTSYFLPLARIEVKSDLLAAITEKRTHENISLKGVGLNSISIFELQAKTAKLRLKTEWVLEAMGVISQLFKIEPYNHPKIVETASALRQTMFTDYIDCIIVSTAIKRNEDLVTEDSKIQRKSKELKDSYGLAVLNFKDCLR